MSVLTIDAENALEAWRDGSYLLMKHKGELSNLLTTIQDPCALDQKWLTTHSAHCFDSNGDNARDVVNTIFPFKLAESASSKDALYSRYLELHDRAKKWPRGQHAWGTYFERLIRFPRSDVNQLDRAIEKLVTWQTRTTTALVFHLSSPTVDAPRVRGGPCWHYGEILWNADGTLDLVVVYRNHDFFNKVLGNYIGLGQLLKFVCAQSQKKTGRLICHSVHAYYEKKNKLLEALEAYDCS
jgi:thymidylate synthase